MQRQLDLARGDFATQIGKLAALSPLAVMERGFAMVRRGDSIVREADNVAVGEQLQVQLARGALLVEVRGVTPSQSDTDGGAAPVGMASAPTGEPKPRKKAKP